MTHFRTLLTRPAALAAVLLMAAAARAQAPAPPGNLQAVDAPWDGGDHVTLTWTASPDEATDGRITGYKVYRTMTERTASEKEEDAKLKEVGRADREARAKAIKVAKDAITAELLGPDWQSMITTLDPERRALVREARKRAGEAAADAADAEAAALAGQYRWKFVSVVPVTGESTHRLSVGDLERGLDYRFQVTAIDSALHESEPVLTAVPVQPTRQIFDGGRGYLAIIVVIFCGAVIIYIRIARGGRPLNVRKIAGLEAIDEAVGRATEMGRPVLFVPGIQDMNEIQTIAGITILSRVAKTAAEYDAKVEVPTSRSLVMTTARETVQSAFLAAGRPDAYNEDLIYYVTDEQFGYVAYLSGMMVREKPAACIYMGAFFAESLILAETGNSIGAIQVAGTAQPAQLPFFVAACDYTLIGEEFFAASAYLSGSAEELGSLKGQDVGKLIVAILLLVGVLAATLAGMATSAGATGLAESFTNVVDWLRNSVLT